MSVSGREVLPDVQEWAGGPPGCPVVWQEVLPDVRESRPDVRECSGGPPAQGSYNWKPLLWVKGVDSH